MTRKDLNDEYFDWMCDIIHNRRHKKLLQILHKIDFTYIIPMDGNRAEDGVELRYRFGYEHAYSNPIICHYLDNKPCSVLEMMVALALRCEKDIMCNDNIGDQTYLWFWKMIESLGLDEETDNRFNVDRVEKIINTFLKREYDHDGHGGLFTIENCENDMRQIEIWYQMCWYMDTIL